MRVLHVIPSVASRYGGPSQALVGLAVAQRRAGMDVTVVIDDPTEEKEPGDGLRSAGIRIVNLQAAEGQLSGRSQRKLSLTELIDRADVVHMHGVWAGIFHEAATIAWAGKVPFVIRSCGMLDEWSLRSKWLKKQLYLWLRFGVSIRRAAALHCTSEMEAQSTARAGIRSRQVIVEPNGVAVEDFAELPEAGTFRRARGIGDRTLVTFLGRVHPGKGLEYLLPALAIIDAKDVVLAVVGPADSAFAKEMMRQAAALAPKCDVIFTGMLRGRDRIPPLADADVFALPSEHENFGVAVVEALAAGCPVVVSKHVGLATEIERQAVGTATTLEPTDIARAISDWIRRGRNDLAGRERRRSYALATFDWNAIATRWQGHYQRLTA